MNNTIKYGFILIVVIAVAVGAGYLLNKKSSKVSVEKTKSPEEVSISDWSIYKNSSFGVQLLYPAEFTVDESGADQKTYPARIDFKSNLVKLGDFGLTIYFDSPLYHTFASKIKTLDDIFHEVRETPSNKVNSSQDITTSNGINVRIVKGTGYAYANGRLDTNLSHQQVNILFMHGTNAFDIYWSCFTLQACYNDQILDKLVQSIKFSK